MERPIPSEAKMERERQPLNHRLAKTPPSVAFIAKARPSADMNGKVNSFGSEDGKRKAAAQSSAGKDATNHGLHCQGAANRGLPSPRQSCRNTKRISPRAADALTNGSARPNTAHRSHRLSSGFRLPRYWPGYPKRYRAGKARRLLPGESPGRVRVGRPPVSRVGPMAERGNP